MIKQEFDYLYKICFLFFFIVLTLPLLAIKPMFYPSDFAKSAVFLAIFPVLFFIFIYQLIFKKNLEEILKIKKAIFDKKNGIFFPFWLLVFYLILFFLSSLFSLDIQYSLWSSPLRGEGFIVYSFLILFSLFSFFILKPKDWQKIWDYSIAVGAITAIIAIFQKFSIFNNFLIGHFDRPPSTIGGSIFLSLYLIILTFLAVSFAILKKSKIRKAFYVISVFLYLTAIALSATRAAFLGLTIGFLFFVFFFPSKSQKIFKVKIAFIILIALSIIFAFWLNTQPQLVQRLSDNRVIGSSFHRTWSMIAQFSFENFFSSRASGWQVAIQGIKNRPILGYGPENFSIAFDRYYDPNLSGIGISPDPSQGRTTWWDKAHSFFFDIGVTAGIPALIIYLLIFAVLFWQLQRIKNKNPDRSLIAHGIQGAFIGYLIADFFGFDSFSTNLTAFLLVAYSIFLIKEAEAKIEEKKASELSAKEEPFWKYLILFFISLFALIFIWNYSIKPLLINKELNKIIYWSENKKCDAAIEKIEDLMGDSHSVMDSFIRLTYLDILGTDCLFKQSDQKKIELYYKAVERLKELMELRPYYTRTWLYHLFYVSQIIENDKNIAKEAKEQLGKEAIASFKKALALSPNRQLIFTAGANLYFSLGEYNESKKIIEECIKINPDYFDCWWIKASTYLKLGENDEGTKIVNLAIKNGFFDVPDAATKTALSEFINLYTSIIKKIAGEKKAEYYGILIQLYQKMIKIEYENFQSHASLAYIYKETGEYAKAKEQALIVLELAPQNKQIVEDFLKTLP